MPRQSRGPSRPVAAPQRPAPPQPSQARHASTAAPVPRQQPHAPAPAQAAPKQSAGPGLFGQMASTAAGVAVGSSIGHAIGGFFGGGSSAAPAPEQQQAVQQQDNGYANTQGYQGPKICETDVTNFRRCMDENQGNLTVCGWYLDQLKACQQAASQY